MAITSRSGSGFSELGLATVSLSNEIKGSAASAASGVAESVIVVSDKAVTEFTESPALLLAVSDDTASGIMLTKH